MGALNRRSICTRRKVKLTLVKIMTTVHTCEPGKVDCAVGRNGSVCCVMVYGQ